MKLVLTEKEMLKKEGYTHKIGVTFTRNLDGKDIYPSHCTPCGDCGNSYCEALDNETYNCTSLGIFYTIEE